jgi:hypothetical protein
MPIKVSSKESPTKTKLLLPTEPVESSGMPDAPIFLQVAPPGWGKTEFAMSNPKCLLAACQQGHELLKGYKVVITSWNDKDRPPEVINDIMHLSFMQLVAQIQEYGRSLPYNMIAIDTLDDLIKMLAEESLGRLRVKHLSDLEFGKGWDMGQNTPFYRAFNRLTKCGVGIIFITHEETKQIEFKKGDNRAKKETTLPRGIYKQVFPILTSVLHGVFGKRRKGSPRRDRIFVTEGSDQILAKNRYGLLPAAWIVPPTFEDRWEQFVSFWDDEEKRLAAFQEFEEQYDLENL